MLPFSQNNHERISQAIDQLSIQIDHLKQESDVLFQDLGITPEQLDQFMAKKKATVSDSDWHTLIEQYKEWDKKLELALKNIRNPKKVKNQFSDLHQMHQLRHCLFVR